MERGERKAVSRVMLLLLLISLVTFLFDIGSVKTESNTWIVDDDGPADFYIIQEAINKASPGDAIYVKAGKYIENLVINKRIALIGENPSITVIDGSANVVVQVVSASVNITGFLIQNGSSGLYIDGSHGGTYTENIITRNQYGLEIHSSSYITLKNNSLFDNLYNFVIDNRAESLSNFMHDIDASNRVDGKPIYYLIGEKNIEVPKDAGFIAVVNSSNIVVRDLDLRDNGLGVLFAYTTDSVIQNVNVSNTPVFGILLSHSDRNIVMSNRLNNSGWGIYDSVSSNYNKIIGNSVANSTFGVLLHGSDCTQNFVSGNILMNNGQAVHLGGFTWLNNVTGNIMMNNGIGLSMDFNAANRWSENTVANNSIGIYSLGTSGNYIYHNNFFNNEKQWSIHGASKDFWDDGYPSGGNYWSDYQGVDRKIGASQDQLGRDGIGDAPYILDAYNRDRYPFMNPWFQDTTPPVANAGLDQVVIEGALTSFDGSGSYDNVGIVSYVWTFLDGTPQTLTGVNPVYAFATLGIYTVTLTVSDAEGNQATDNITITVLPSTPEVAIQRLIEKIEIWDLPRGIQNSFASKLEGALHLLSIGNEKGALHKLMDLISQVEALWGKKLTDEQAGYLVSEAQKIIAIIEYSLQ